MENGDFYKKKKNSGSVKWQKMHWALTLPWCFRVIFCFAVVVSVVIMISQIKHKVVYYYNYYYCLEEQSDSIYLAPCNRFLRSYNFNKNYPIISSGLFKTQIDKIINYLMRYLK